MTELEAVILHAVRDGGRTHGLAIGRTAEEILGKVVGVGTLYKNLHRLEREGYVTSEWEEESSGQGGRKRYYTLSGLGAQALGEYRTTLRRVSRALLPKGA